MLGLRNGGFLWKSLIEIGLFSAVVNVLLLVSPLYMLQIYDRVLPASSMSTLIYLSLFAFGALVVLGALEIVRAYYANRIAAHLDVQMGSQAFLAALTGPRAGLGDVQPLRDLSIVRGFISSRQIFALFDLPFAPLFIAILYFLHPILFWITIVGAVLLLLVAVANQMATSKSGQKAGEILGGTMNSAQAFARNFETVRALGMSSSVTEVWGKRFAESLDANDSVSNINAFFGGVSRLLRMALQMAILGVGAYLVLQEHMTAGIIFASSIISGRALQPLDQIIGGWRQIIEARRSWGRLVALSNSPLGRKPETIALPVPTGALSIDQLVYYVPDANPTNPLIKKISFRVQAGESVAIIGPSQAGKSTLARLIVGAIKPHSGSIQIDGADIQNWDPDVLGAHMGYLAQDVELFPGTIAENIARFLPERQDEDIITAARRAQAHQMIVGQKKAYMTDVGPGGVRLSGGERQRIGLARAFFGGPKLLVLDEPNANLDAEGEQGLERAVANAREAKVTVLLITHKPSIAAKCDRILMLRDGQIELYGPAADVLQKLAQGNAPAAAPPQPAAQPHPVPAHAGNAPAPNQAHFVQTMRGKVN